MQIAIFPGFAISWSQNRKFAIVWLALKSDLICDVLTKISLGLSRSTCTYTGPGSATAACVIAFMAASYIQEKN